MAGEPVLAVALANRGFVGVVVQAARTAVEAVPVEEAVLVAVVGRIAPEAAE